MGAFIDRTGHAYGRLIVIKRAGNDKHGNAIWLCECQCGSGKPTIVSGNLLARGNTRSCGCLRIEALCRITHGAAYSPEYNSYGSAKSRCENSNDSGFHNYGGRSIRFLYGSFEEFFSDLGPKPPGLTIERINNAGNYEPGNCKWATRLEQNNNTRSNRRLTAFGRTQTLAQWAREYGINSATLTSRIDRGVPLEQAVRL